jgi:hypothetical protein
MPSGAAPRSLRARAIAVTVAFGLGGCHWLFPFGAAPERPALDADLGRPDAALDVSRPDGARDQPLGDRTRGDAQKPPDARSPDHPSLPYCLAGTIHCAAATTGNDSVCVSPKVCCDSPQTVCSDPTLCVALTYCCADSECGPWPDVHCAPYSASAGACWNGFQGAYCDLADTLYCPWNTCAGACCSTGVVDTCRGDACLASDKSRRCCTGADCSSGKCTRTAGKGINPGTCL